MGILNKGVLDTGGGGGGTSPIKGEVTDYASLPVSATIGDLYLVLNSTGLLLFANRKLKGLYRWNGTSWDRITGAEANQTIYTNTGSTTPLVATDVKSAIDELDLIKEPSFVKNTAFNKNFGTTAGTIAEGNDLRITDSFQKSTDTLDNITTGTTNKHFTATDESKLDSLPSQLQNLTTAEIQQLENIGTSTISAAQWGYLGGLDQALATTDNPTFNSLTLTTDLSVANGGTGASTFTAGYLLFGNGTSSINTNSNIFWDNANNRLGIGTTTPTAKLHVAGNTNISNGLIKIDTEGNSLQTTTPLTITQTNVSYKETIRLRNTTLINAGSAIVFGSGNGSYQVAHQSSIVGGHTGGGNTHLAFRTNSGANYDQDVEAMRIDHLGNVGIGTTSPTEKLHVVGNAIITGNTTINNITGNTTINNGFLGDISTTFAVAHKNHQTLGNLALRQNSNGETVVNAASGQTLRFGIADSHKMIMASTGNITMTSDLSIAGALSKGSGSFDIPHPDPLKNKTHRLRHYFVETPSAGGNIYKYQKELKEGENFINLPNYYKYLNKDSLVWVNPFRHFGRAWGVVIENKQIKIVAEREGFYNILVFADRKDELAMAVFNKYGVEYHNNLNE